MSAVPLFADWTWVVYVPGASVTSNAASLLPAPSGNAPTPVLTVEICPSFAQPALVATTAFFPSNNFSCGAANGLLIPKVDSDGPTARIRICFAALPVTTNPAIEAPFESLPLTRRREDMFTSRLVATGPIVNWSVRSFAALCVASPDCAARTMTVPVLPVTVSVLPLKVAGPLTSVYEMGKPADDVASSVTLEPAFTVRAVELALISCAAFCGLPKFTSVEAAV
jgi:hypothetical protein